jgi:hypothetical protein
MGEGTVASSGSDEGRLLRSALGKTPECLPIEALAAMDATARAHVEHCAYCQNELAMLVEFQEATPRPEEAAAVTWIQSELERRSATNPQARPSEGLWARVSSWISRAFPSRGWQMIPVAAGLLLVVAGGMYLRQGNDGLKPPTGGEPVWRSQGFAGVAPLGDVTAAPAELQWDAVPGAAKYLVRVMEVDRTEIWRSEASSTRIVLPPEVRGQMTAGRSFLWTVTARNDTGSIVAETGLQTFHISATSR